MISFVYKRAHDALPEERNEFNYGAWVHVEAPTNEELTYLTDTFNLEKSLLTDALDINEVPRIEQEEGAIYLFTRYVLSQKDRVFTTPVLIIYRKKVVITIAPKSVPQVNAIMSQKGNWSTYDTEGFVLLLLFTLNTTIERSLNTISRLIQQSRIKAERIGTKELMLFVDMENSLYDINGLLVRLENLVSTLLTKPWLKRTEDQEEYLKDIYLAIQQMLDVVKENIRTVVNTREAVSTIMTANLNRVIKLFTSLTVLLTVPMLVATFYGMNIPLPLANSPSAFFTISMGTIIVSLGLLVLFVKNDWL
jgi:magnesium transporter